MKYSTSPLPAFAFYTTTLSQYVDSVVHNIVKNSQYCHHIVTTLSTYCDNIVHHIVNFHTTINIYVNRMWSQYYENSTILWPHTVNIYVNHIVKVDKMVDILLKYVDNMVTTRWQYCEFFRIWWRMLSTYFNSIVTKNAKAGDDSGRLTLARITFNQIEVTLRIQNLELFTFFISSFNFIFSLRSGIRIS